MTLLQIPLVFTNSVSWDLNETHMHTHACSHIQTCKHIHTLSMIHGKHLRPKERQWNLKKKMERKSTEIQEMCFKQDTASFLPCTVVYAVCMYTSTLSGWRQHPLQLLCICSLHLKDTESFIFKQYTKWRMQRAPERWRGGEDSSHSPEDNRGETFGTLSEWTLMKPVRILGESRDFDNTISPPLAAAKAYCFLLWMFGSNQPLPNTLSLQLHT